MTRNSTNNTFEIVKKVKEVFCFNGKEYSTQAEADAARVNYQINDLVEQHGGYRGYLDWVSDFVEEYGERLLPLLQEKYGVK